MRSRTENWSLRFLFPLIIIKRQIKYVMKLLPDCGHGDWFGKTVCQCWCDCQHSRPEWQCPCVWQGRVQVKTETCLFRPNFNIVNFVARVSIVEDIQPGTKFAKVIFCLFSVSCLFKQSTDTPQGQSPLVCGETQKLRAAWWHGCRELRD